MFNTIGESAHPTQKIHSALGKAILRFLEELEGIEVDGVFYEVQVLQDYPITQVVAVGSRQCLDQPPRYFSINTRWRGKPPLKLNPMYSLNRAQTAGKMNFRKRAKD